MCCCRRGEPRADAESRPTQCRLARPSDAVERRRGAAAEVHLVRWRQLGMRPPADRVAENRAAAAHDVDRLAADRRLRSVAIDEGARRRRARQRPRAAGRRRCPPRSRRSPRRRAGAERRARSRSRPRRPPSSRRRASPSRDRPSAHRRQRSSSAELDELERAFERLAARRALDGTGSEIVTRAAARACTSSPATRQRPRCRPASTCAADAARRDAGSERQHDGHERDERHVLARRLPALRRVHRLIGASIACVTAPIDGACATIGTASAQRRCACAAASLCRRCQLVQHALAQPAASDLERADPSGRSPASTRIPAGSSRARSGAIRSRSATVGGRRGAERRERALERRRLEPWPDEPPQRGRAAADRERALDGRQRRCRRASPRPRRAELPARRRAAGRRADGRRRGRPSRAAARPTSSRRRRTCRRRSAPSRRRRRRPRPCRSSASGQRAGGAREREPRLLARSAAPPRAGRSAPARGRSRARPRCAAARRSRRRAALGAERPRLPRLLGDDRGERVARGRGHRLAGAAGAAQLREGAPLEHRRERRPAPAVPTTSATSRRVVFEPMSMQAQRTRR